MAATTEARELDLVHKAQFKILGVANNEKKLEETLKVYICPLLLKASSPNSSVRSEVIKFASSLQTIIKPTTISLPVEGLVDQYKAQESPIVRQVDFMFITLGIDRMDDFDRRKIVHKIAKGISSAAQGGDTTSIFRIFLRVLPSIRIPSRGTKEDLEFRESIGLSDDSDAAWVADWLGKVLLLKLPHIPQGSESTFMQVRERLQASNYSLTDEELKFLNPEMRENSWAPPFDQLVTLRRKIAQLLASAAFTDREKLVPAIFAASSPDSVVSDDGNDMLKRTTVSFDDDSLAKDLFSAHGRMTAPYRIKILGLLSKSVVSTSMEEQIKRVVEMDSGMKCPEHLQPQDGLERAKLSKAFFGYLSFVAMWGPTKGPFEVGKLLMSHMQLYITSKGWPAPSEDLAGRDVRMSSGAELRGMAYDLIGLLAKATKLNMPEALALAGWLFRSLSEDPTPDVVFHIESALSSLTKHFDPSQSQNERDLIHLACLLYDHLFKPDEAPAVRSVRYNVVKWANQCFPFSEWRARCLDVFAIGGKKNESHDVVEEGRKGLDPWTYRVDDISKIPDWGILLRSLFLEPTLSLFSVEFVDPSVPASPLIDPNEMNHSLESNFQGDDIRAFPVALNFTKQMMYLAALPDFSMGPDWANQLDTALKSDVKTRSKVSKYMDNIITTTPSMFLRVCIDGAVSELTRDYEQAVEASLQSLVDVASLASFASIAHLAHRAPALHRWSASNNARIRLLAARAIALLGAHPVNKPALSKALQYPADSEAGIFGAMIKQMTTSIAQWDSAIGSAANAVEGDILAFGYLFSQAVYYGLDLRPPMMLPAGLLWDNGQSSSMQDAAIDAFAQLWTAGVDAAIPKEDSNLTPESVIKCLKAKADAGNEKAIFALGRLAMAFTDSSEPPLQDSKAGNHVDSILEALFELAQKKEPEIHFTVGESIAAAIARRESDSVMLSVSVKEMTDSWMGKMAARSSRVPVILNKLFADCKGTAPHSLKSSGIWLFCLIQHCGQLQEIQSRLREAQVAFMRLLSARDELVQETASRGLVLIYEKGDKDLRSLLVDDLVSSFTGQSTKLQVQGDTELFEAGALPTGDGKSVTSYKDIVALANEVGDQSLVYKFMALANNAATWSTRAAFGRFGLGDILADSHIDPKVYPKLFRYRFDPNKNAQRSMEAVWKALVKDTNGVIQEHFDAIISDLLKTILGKEWRSREASCTAISDLIGGQPFEKYASYYEEIWTAALKVLDDVKGSVREAALKLCMGLTNTIVRLLEDGSGATSAQAMLNEALRFLLSPSGVESSVKDIQAFSLHSIINITKKGGNVLGPFVSTIVPHLLNLHSTIEAEQLNYAYQKVAEDTRDKIDKMRASAISTSPITDAVNNCLRQLDAVSMKQLAPKMESTIKSAIGMQTKIACGRLLTDLVLRHRIDFEPYAAKFLHLMAKECLDRNDEVSRSYATAAAYLMRVAPDESKQRFVDKFMQVYLEAEEDARRRKASDVFLAYSKSSPDEFNKMEAKLLPFAYVASHDTDAKVKKAFATTWENHAGSSRTVARYVEEIVGVISQVLEARHWGLKHTGAFATAAMIPALVSASDATNGQISEASLKIVWPVFDKVLALKTFDGKEKVLASFPVLVEKGGNLWRRDETVAAQMKKIALREAKRNNEAYRVHALEQLWKFASARNDLDLLGDVFAIVQPFLDSLLEEDRMEVDSEDRAADLAANGLEAVARGYSRNKLKEDSYAVLDGIMKLLKPYLSSATFALIKREKWYECVRDVMREAAPGKGPVEADGEKGLALTYLLSLDMDLVDVGTEAQRGMRAQAMGAVFKAKAQGVFGPTVEGSEKEGFVRMVQGAMEKERSLEVLRQLRKIREELG